MKSKLFCWGAAKEAAEGESNSVRCRHDDFEYRKITDESVLLLFFFFFFFFGGDFIAGDWQQNLEKKPFQLVDFASTAVGKLVL